MILTTEDHVDPTGATLIEIPLLWYGARVESAWQKRPVPVASEPRCQIRRTMQEVQIVQVPHQGALPEAGTKKINIHVSALTKSDTRAHPARLVRRFYAQPALALTA